MLLHTTRLGLEVRLDTSAAGYAFTHGPRPAEADQALGYAHAFVVQLLHACNGFFRWGLDLDPLIDDAEKCWGEVGLG